MIDYNKVQEYSHHGLVPTQREFEPGDKIFSHRNDCGFAYVLAHDIGTDELFVQPSRVAQVSEVEEKMIPAHAADTVLPGEFPDYGHSPDIELVEEAEIESFFANETREQSSDDDETEEMV